MIGREHLKEVSELREGLVEVFVVVDNGLAEKVGHGVAVGVEPLLPDPVVDVFEFELPLGDQGWRFELLVHLGTIRIPLLHRELANVVVQDLHHVLLVPDPVLVEELLWEGPHSKCLLQLLTLSRVDEGKPNLALQLIGEHPHGVDHVHCLPELLLASSLPDKGDIPVVLRRLSTIENLTVHLICHFNNVMLG